MSITPADIAKLSDTLVYRQPLSVIPDEVIARSSVSRAYYAGFHCLQELIRDHLGKSDYRVSHDGLMSYLQSCSSQIMDEVHEVMGRARRQRHISDYHLQGAVAIQTAKMIVRDVQDLVLKRTAEIAAAIKKEKAPLPANSPR